MMSLFEQMEAILQTAEKVSFSIEKTTNGQLAVLVQPVMRDYPDCPDGVAQIRGTLSMPVRVVDSATNLDAGFLQKMVAWNQGRSSLATEDSFVRFNESAKEAKASAQKAVAKQAKSAKSKTAATTNEKPGQAKAEAAGKSDIPAPTAPAGNPVSLF